MSDQPTQSPKPETPKNVAEPEVSRRDFFSLVVGGALGVAGVGAGIVTVEYVSPNVLFEPPTSFRAGRPDDYPPGQVTFFQEQQVYLIRTQEGGFFALSAVCTHLGCVTEWHPETNLIQCPCHGSHFRRNGSVEHGPAPRPLPHFAVRLMPDGTLLVDKLEQVPGTEILKV